MTNGDRPSRSFAPGPIARAALRCVPDRWRDSVTRDLIEEATRSGRGRSTGELWIAFHACRIAQTLRRQASSASSPLSPRRSAMLGQLGSDLGFAFRMLRRQWRPSAAIVLTLALGIGATTTVYAVFNHLVLRPMPGVREPERLVSIVFQPEDQPRTWASGVLPYEVLGAPGSGLESIALWSGSPDEAPAVLHPGDDPRLIEVEFVAPDYLETLGVRARIGRLFTAEETRESGHQVALISEHLWQRDFGGRDDVLGRSINVRGEPFVIAGVLDDYRSWSATPANHADVWLPEPEDRAPGTPLATVSLLVARLAPGQDASTIQSRLRQLYEPHRAALTGRAATLVPWVYPGLRMGPTGGRLDAQPFSVIFGASALLLLLACANAANLLLATNARRRQDLALRAAIGASRPRLMRGLIVEAVVLGAIAVAAGLALTWTIAQLVDGLQIFSSTGALSDVTIDWRVVLFASAAGVATVLVFALMPILAATRLDLRTVLQEHSRGATTSKRVGRALVAVQLALSLTLMAGAGVLVRSLWNLRGIDLGIRPEGVYGFTFDPRLAGVRGAAAGRLLARVVSDLRETPGVESVTTANPSPFNDSLNLSAELRLEGESPAPSVAVKGPSVVSPDYFRTLGVPLRAGRTFTEAETALEDDVPLRSAIVSAEAARALFGDASPIGRRVVLGRIARSGEWRRQRVLDIIGVAGEARTAATLRAASPPPTVYESSGPILVYSRVYVKSSLPATEMAARVRRVLWTANARLLPVEAGTIADEVERLYPEDRASAWLLVTIAAVATLLGFAGVYAVTAHSVSERTREFGVRIALGASSSAVVRQAGRGVVTVAIAGVAAGLIAYGFASRLIAARLFGVTPLEPATIAMAMALLCLVVGVATWLPARRATRIDPVVALRE